MDPDDLSEDLDDEPRGTTPVYHGFDLVPETATEGWYYGAITTCHEGSCNPEGCDSGDGFVQAPDGTRAGIVWEIGEGDMYEICPPEADRWGVWGVWFPQRVKTLDDLILNFRNVLPSLQAKYREINTASEKAG